MSVAKAVEKLLQDAHPTRQKDLYEACAKALDTLRKEAEKVNVEAATTQATRAVDTSPDRDTQPDEKGVSQILSTSPTPGSGASDPAGTTEASLNDSASGKAPLSLGLVKEAQQADGSLPSWQSSGALPAAPAEHLVDTDSFVYWQPFRVALSRALPAKTKELALVCLHSLIARKSFRGAQPLDDTPAAATDASVGEKGPFRAASESSFSRQSVTGSLASLIGVANLASGSSAASSPPFLKAHVIDDMVNRICNCYPGEEAVQLQVIKVLLTAVTTSGIEVHDASLMSVVQTCCNVYLYSKSQVNQVTAKASLTQIVIFLMQKMEAKFAELRKKEPEPKGALSGLADSSVNKDTLLDDAASTIIEASDFGEKSDEKLASEANEVNSTLERDAVSRGSLSDFTSGAGDNELRKAARMAEEEIREPVDVRDEEDWRSDDDDGEDGPESGAARRTSSRTTVAFGEHSRGRPCIGVGRSAALAADGRVVDDITDKQENTEVPTISPYSATPDQYAALLRKDMCMLIELLCKLSMKSDKGDTDDPTSPEMRCRILALELLLSAMSNSGPVFQSDDRFVPLIRALCVSLSRNGVSTNPHLFELSLSLFLMVLRNFRSKLKAELEVLFNEIYLHILDMSNSTYKQKSMVLQGLAKVCSDPQTLVDIYVNYDCDISTISIYEKMVNSLSKIAQSRQVRTSESAGRVAGSMGSATGPAALLLSIPDRTSAESVQDARLRLRALECFVAIVDSLAEWSKEAYSVPKSASTTVLKDVEDMIRSDSPMSTQGISSAPKPSEKKQTPSSPYSPQQREQPNASQTPVLVSKKPLKIVSMHSAGVGVSAPGNADAGTGPPHRTESPTPATNAGGGGGCPSPGSVPTTAEPLQPATQYEAMSSKKKAFEAAVQMFNSKPSKAMRQFIEQGFVRDDPVDIAKFLLATNTLAKSAIGELIGEGDEKSIKIMYAFVDVMDFTATGSSGLPSATPSGPGKDVSADGSVSASTSASVMPVDGGFVRALRTFLQAFRLPGEAQKISRIMEKFADRYCECNPGVFPDADSAYILAYSVIMLNTDQHSSQVKHRMDKQMFIRNNRGQCNGGDFPEEFLGAIFDDITKNEIVMEEEQISELEKQAISSARANEKQRKELYRRETAQMQKKSQALLKTTVHGHRQIARFRNAVHVEHVRPMFAVSCWPLMATLSTVFEEAGDLSVLDAAGDSKLHKHGSSQMPTDVTHLCVNGFTGAIRISSVFRMETERDAFVSSLAKLTGLNRVHELREKHIAAIRALIGVGSSFGEYLEGSWATVLSIISQMDRLQLIGGGSPSGQDFGNSGSGRLTSPVKMTVGFLDSLARATVPGVSSEKEQQGGSSGTESVDLAALYSRRPSLAYIVKEMQSQATLVSVDRIFTGTVSLSGTAIVHFFRALCSVSLSEVESSPTQPRMYSLSRIVEMAYYNMGRIRYEWTQIWKVLQPHFNIVGCHPNVEVATFAVDSLRQLSMKFLDRDELAHFHTQNDFLKPFEHIMKANQNPAIRDLIIQSFHQMVSARARNIRSGWKSIFVVLSRAASVPDRHIVAAAFAVVQDVYKSYFEHVGSAFVDYVSCLVEFASARACEDVVPTSIRLLVSCAKSLVAADARERQSEMQQSCVQVETVKLAADLAPEQSEKRGPALPTIQIDEDVFFLQWFPVLSGLSRITIDSELPAIRAKAVDALFDLLKNFGGQFHLKFWKAVFRSVLMPIFEDLKDPDFKKREAYSVIWIQALRLLVDLHTAFFDALSAQAEFTQSVLDLMVLLVSRKSENLSQTGAICLSQLVARNGHRFLDDHWDRVTDAMEKIFALTTPGELTEYDVLAKSWAASGHAPMTDGALPRPDASGTSSGADVATSTSSNGEQVLPHPDTAELSRAEFPYGHVIAKCAVHLVAIQSIRDIALGEGISQLVIMPRPFRNRWLQCLYQSYEFARSFNENYDLRLFLWKTRRVPQMPNLIKQETLSITTYVQLLLHLYRAFGDAGADDELEAAVKETKAVLQKYVGMLEDPQRYARELASWSHLVVTVYRELLLTPWYVNRGRGVTATRLDFTRELEDEKSRIPALDSGVADVGVTTKSSETNSPPPAIYRIVDLVGIRSNLPEYLKFAIRLTLSDKADIRTSVMEFMERIANDFLAEP